MTVSLDIGRLLWYHTYMARHNCNNGATDPGDRPTCSACGGWIHEAGCTSRRNPERDCCDARHIKLYKQGQTVGIWDSSVPMLEGVKTEGKL